MAYINKINVDGVEYEVKDENALPAADLPEAINTALAHAKESGAFDGPAGEQGPQGPAGESGVYVGTEAPTDPNVKVWINPNGVATFPMPTVDDAGKVLTAVGANEAEWGEASAGSEVWETIVEGEITVDDATSLEISADSGGNAFSLKKFVLILTHNWANVTAGYLTINGSKSYVSSMCTNYGFRTLKIIGDFSSGYFEGLLVPNGNAVWNNLVAFVSTNPNNQSALNQIEGSALTSLKIEAQGENTMVSGGKYKLMGVRS